MTPRLSIILATHNRAALLNTALEALQRQTFQDFEILVVDDGSSDPTPEVLAAWQKKEPRLQAFRFPDCRGCNAARNLALGKARGIYIGITDDDDVSLPGRFETQIAFLEENPSVQIVFSSIQYIDLERRPLRLWPEFPERFPREPDRLFEVLFTQPNIAPNSAALFRREVFDKFRLSFPENVISGGDRLLYMKAAALGVQMAMLAEPWVHALSHEGHVSLTGDILKITRNKRAVLDEMRSWLKENGIHRFDGLYAKALSYQLIIEGRACGGVKGLFLVLKALGLNPSGRYAWETFFWFLKKAARRARLTAA
ncbi:MAG TPA: glycosyltransferase family 2 protein [Verrucomicrobiae bacterium]|nr:glycosyltransferase family 2 protein [Verrucomicrobiae bacterium]